MTLLFGRSCASPPSVDERYREFADYSWTHLRTQLGLTELSPTQLDHTKNMDTDSEN